MIYFNVYIKLDFPITHRNAEVFCKLESAYLHNTVNMEVFTVKSNKKKIPKRESTHANVQSCPYNEEGIVRFGKN